MSETLILWDILSPSPFGFAFLYAKTPDSGAFSSVGFSESYIFLETIAISSFFTPLILAQPPKDSFDFCQLLYYYL
jgi:hypothetical protein